MIGVRRVPQGQGLVATKGCTADALLLEEAPLCFVRGPGPHHSPTWSLTAKVLDSPEACSVLGRLQPCPVHDWDAGDDQDLVLILQSCSRTQSALGLQQLYSQVDIKRDPGFHCRKGQGS